MSDVRPDTASFDGALFITNVNRFPADALAEYAGRHVAWNLAWNLDASKILASGADRDELEANLLSAGIDPSQVVWDYIPGPGEDTWLL